MNNGHRSSAQIHELELEIRKKKDELAKLQGNLDIFNSNTSASNKSNHKKEISLDNCNVGDSATQSYETARALLNASTESAFLIDVDGVFVDMNDITAQRLGKRVDDLIGHNAFDFVPKDVAQKRKEKLDEVITTKKPIRMLDNRDGVSFDTHIYPILDSKGEVFRIAIFAKDITREKLDEVKLVDSENKFRLLAENSYDIIYRYELKPSQGFTYISPSSFHVTGYHPDDFYADPDLSYKITIPDDLKIVESIFSNSDEFDNPIIIRWKHRNGNLIWTEQKLVKIIDDNGDLIAIEGIARDITDRITEEEQEKKLSEMNEKLHLISELPEKLKYITDGIVSVFHSDFVRIWVLKPCDDSDYECAYSKENNNSFECRMADECLHLLSSSGRYTHTTGGHRRIPVGCLKIGEIIAGKRPKFISNNILKEKQIDTVWAKKLGLKSFAGFRLVSDTGNPIGVIGIFSKEEMSQIAVGKLKKIADTTSHVIQTALKENALQDSLLKLNEVVNASNVGLWDWDLISNNVSYSSVWKKQIGYKEHEINNDYNEWKSRVHPDDLQKALKDTQNCINKKSKEYLTEFRFKHKDGSYKWILAKGTLLLDKNGKPIRMIGSHLDITDRKKSEERIEMLSTVVEQSPSYVIITDKHGKIEYVNKAFTEITGYSSKEAIGQSPNIFISNAMQQDWKDNVWQTVQEGKIWRGELKTKYKNSKQHYEKVLVTPVINEKGKILRFFSIHENITKQKEIENALEESEEKFRKIAERSVELIVLHDLDATYKYLSPSITSLLGYMPEELIGKSPYELIHTDDVKTISEKIYPYAKKGKSIPSFHYRIKHKSGKYLWFNSSATPIYENGKVVAFQTISSDITERVQLNNALRDSEKKLKEANATKDKFFSIIAHDLKSPIGSLAELLSYMDNNLELYKQENLKKHINICAVTSKKMLNLLQELLMWSRSQRNIIKINPESINLQDYIEENIAISKQSAVKKEINIDFQVLETLNIYADKKTADTVLRNIISNAIKFTPRNGNILISANEIKQDNKPFIELIVKDNGVGIPKEKIPQLFNIGADTSTPGTENEPGTGFGLILCKEFVDKNGGRIWVESEEDKGTSVFFTMPKP